jgi:hypothetical protein
LTIQNLSLIIYILTKEVNMNDKLELEKLMKSASYLYKILTHPSQNYISFAIKDIYTVSPVPWQVKGFVEGARACELHGHPLNPFDEDGTFEVELVRLKPEYYATIDISFERDSRFIHSISLEVKKSVLASYVFYRTVYSDTLQKYARYSAKGFSKLLDIITNNHLTDESKRTLYELKVIPTIIITAVHSLLNFSPRDTKVVGSDKRLSDGIKALEELRDSLRRMGENPIEILSTAWLGYYFHL